MLCKIRVMISLFAFTAVLFFKGNRRLGTCYSLEGRSLFEIDLGCFRKGFRAKITRLLLD